MAAVRGAVALTRWRKKSGHSQRAAAELVGVSQSTWASYEAGRYRPEYDRAARIEIASEGAVRVETFGYDAGAAISLAQSPWRRETAEREGGN